MATVDKLTLELSADGVNSFIKAMEDAENGLKDVREGMEKTAKENGIFEKKIDKKDKKKQKKEKKNDKDKEKASKKFNKSIEDGTKSLDKFLKTLLAISGISFGLNGLMSKSEEAAQRGTDLANQALNTQVKTEDIETAQTTAKAMGRSENTLDNFMAMFAKNQNLYLDHGESTLDVQKLFGILYGFDKSGKYIEQFNTDPYETMKGLSDILRSNDSITRSAIINKLEEAGYDSNALNMLSDERFLNLWMESRKLAIQNKDRTKRSQQANSAMALSDKSLQNQWDDLGLALTPIRIKLNKLAEEILEEVNKMTPMIEEAMPALEKMIQTIVDWVRTILKKLKEWGIGDDGQLTKDEKSEFIDEYLDKNKNLSKGEISVLREKDKEIKNIDYENNKITANDNRTYESGKWSSFPTFVENYFEYILKEGKINQSDEAPTTQQLMQQSNSSISNSTSQFINVENMNVNTNENNAQAIVQNSVKDTKILTMSGSAAMAFMHNYG